MTGGEALDPLLLGHPLSRGVAIATINIQNNFFIGPIPSMGIYYVCYMQCRFYPESNLLKHTVALGGGRTSF